MATDKAPAITALIEEHLTSVDDIVRFDVICGYVRTRMLMAGVTEHVRSGSIANGLHYLCTLGVVATVVQGGSSWYFHTGAPDPRTRIIDERKFEGEGARPGARGPRKKSSS